MKCIWIFLRACVEDTRPLNVLYVNVALITISSPAVELSDPLSPAHWIAIHSSINNACYDRDIPFIDYFVVSE